MAAAMVHMQAAVRRHIAANRCLAKRELRVRRRINEQSAAILMQTQIRLKLARLLLIRMRLRRDNLITARLNASQRIAAFCAEGMRRFKAKLSGVIHYHIYKLLALLHNHPFSLFCRRNSGDSSAKSGQPARSCSASTVVIEPGKGSIICSFCKPAERWPPERYSECSEAPEYCTGEICDSMSSLLT